MDTMFLRPVFLKFSVVKDQVFFFFNALLANAFLKYNKKVTIKLK